MVLAAIGGYVAGTVFGTGTAVTANPAVYAAPGSVLRQDNPSQAPADVPDWIQKEWGTEPAPGTIKVDDPAFVSQYYTAPPPRAGHGFRELD